MKVQIMVNEPKTIHVSKFKNNGDFKKIVVTKNGKIYYERDFKNPCDSAKFNIPDKGIYIVMVDNIALLSSTPLKHSKAVINLPEPEKDLKETLGKYKVKKDNRIGQTPMCISTKRKEILYNDRYLNLPIYAQKFIFFHELGHRFYRTEAYCDLYATKRMLQAGYSESCCLNSLKNVLNRNEQSLNRLSHVFSQLTS